ncbi:MAG: phage virion morphogenesis protein [Desulfobulbus sp.]|jgi:phage virion morphogenesis protein|uniref:phage virion morphogenesis protein n=1 Tax=Desulfobulbus sp. TaxID=895 RepID=UPI00284F7043|nr:phage virion morphogenesis protein [Desulfobulbus sp.]MDR2551444.1 phage virion morphogenesis protein [Desulfobulbus sp.]
MAGAFQILARIDDREVMAALERLRAHTDRMAPVFKVIGESLLRSTRQRFRDQMDPEGRPWQALKPSTVAAKAARGHSGNILRARGHLADTIHYQADNNGMRLGTNRIYGAIHQLGGKTSPHVIRPRTKKALAWPGARHPARSVNHPGSDIPAREYLGFSRQDRDRILEIVTDHWGMGL